MKTKQLIHVSQIATLSRQLYERGFLLFALIVMLFGMLCSALSESEPMRQLSSLRQDLRDAAAIKTERLNPPLTKLTNRPQRTQWLESQAQNIARLMKTHQIRNAAIYHRVKSDESAAEKARRKNVTVSELNDIYGMRIVVENELDAYRALAAILHKFPLTPHSLKDYIRTPKPSGYQSLHAVASIDGARVEFQIRTRSMHAASEAEHESYKKRVHAA